MTPEDFQTAILDPQKWRLSLSAERRQQLDDTIQGEPDQAGAINRVLSIGHVANVTGINPHDVANHWDTVYRPQFAMAPGGLAMDTAPKDDGEFFQALQGGFKTKKAESDLLQDGPGSLFERAHMAGIDGKDYTQAFADWQSEAIGQQGYDMAKTDAYAKAGRAQYEDSLQRGNYGDVGKIADRALSFIEGAQVMTKGGKVVAQDMGTMDRERLADDLANYSPEKRREVYDIVARKAQAQGLDPKSAFRAIDSAMRGFDTLANGTMQLAGRAGAAMLSMANDSGLEAAAKKINDKQLVFGELTQLANGQIDPIKAKGWASTATNSLGGLVPFVTSGGLGAFGTVAMLGGISNDVTNQVKYANPEMSQGAADSIGIISGTAQTFLLGKMGEWLTESAPGVSQLLVKYTAPSMSAGTRYAAHAIGQVASQGLVFGAGLPMATPLAQQLVSTVNSTVPGVNWGDERAKMFEAFPESIAPILVLSIIGAHVATARDYAVAKDFVANPDALKALGFNSAQVAKIRAAPDQIEALRSEYPNRPNDAPSMMEGAKAYAEQVKAGQVAVKTLEERGVLPVIARTEADKWTITTKDGGAAHFPDWESANAARWQHVEDNRMSVDDTTRAILDHMSQRLDVGRGHGVEFSPEAPTARDMASDGTPEADLLRRVDQSQLLDGGQSEAEAFDKATAVSDAAATTPEDTLAKQRILGSSKTEFQDGVLVTTMKLFQGATPLTLVEEKVHGDVAHMIATPSGRQWAIDKLRGYEAASGERVLLDHDDAKVQDSDIQEAWASIAQGYLVRESARRPGLVENWKAKGFRQAFREVLRSPVGPEINAYSELFGAAALRAAQLGKLKREGKLDKDLETTLAKHLGLSEASQHESAVLKTAAEMRDGMGGDGSEKYTPSTDEPFSMSRISKAASAPALEVSVKPWEGITAKERGDRAAQEARELRSGPPIVNADRGKVIDVSRAGLEHWARFATDPRKASLLGHLRELLTDAIYIRSEKPDARKVDAQVKAFHKLALPVRFDGQESMVRVSVREDANGRWVYDGHLLDVDAPADDVPKGSSWPESQSETRQQDVLQRARLKTLTEAMKVNEHLTAPDSFSLARGMVNAKITEMFSPFLRTPEARKELGKEMQRRAKKAAEPWIEASNATRSAASLKSERDVREAAAYDSKMKAVEDSLSPAEHAALSRGFERLDSQPLIERMLNDHGKILSRAGADQRGKLFSGEYDDAPWLPPQWLAADGIGPDVMTGNLGFDSISDFWAAIKSEIATGTKANAEFRAAEAKMSEGQKKARQEAKAEAGAWYDNALTKSGKVAMEREKIAGAIRTLDAIKRALPAELRGKIGGEAKLASLGTDEARLAEIGRLAGKIDRVVETWMRDDLHEQFVKLLDKANPAKGKPGEASKGKIGVEGHRWFDQVREVHGLNERQVSDQQAVIESRLTDDKTTPEERDALIDQWGILNTYGDFKNRSAAEMDTALASAKKIYESGRDSWKIQVEARREDRKQFVAQGVEDVGGAKTTTERRKARKGEVAEDQQISMLSKFSGPDHQSFGSRLASIFGGGSKTAERYERAVHDAYHAKNRAMIEKRLAFRDQLLKVFGVKSWMSASDKLYELQLMRDKSGITKIEGRKSETITLPVDKAQDLLDGKIKPETLGLHSGHLDDVQRAMDVWALTDSADKSSVDRAQSIKLEITRAVGERSEVPMSQNEAMHLTMLAKQESYRNAMDFHGWDEQSLAEMEAMLSPEAKQIRSWLHGEYNRGYDELNKVHQAMFGIDLPRVKDYAPGYFERAGEVRDLDPFASGIESAGLAAGFLKRRKNHSAEPVMIDALQAFWQHQMMVTHWVHFAPEVQEMRAVLGSLEVRHAVEGNESTAAHRSVMRWLNVIEQNGVKDAQSNSWVRRFGQALTRSALSFNIGTWMKHLPNAVMSMGDVPLFEWSKSLGRVMSGQGAESLANIWRSPVIRDRLLGSYTPELRQILEGQTARDGWKATATQWNRHLGNFLDYGVSRISHVAGMFTTFSAAVAHDYHYNQAKGEMSHEQAMRYADHETALTVARTSAPESLDRRSLAELERMGAAKLLLMFHGPERAQWGMEYSAIADAINGKGSKAKAAQVVFLSHVVVPVMMQTMVGLYRYMFTSDDADKAWSAKKYATAMVMGPLSGIYGLGQILEPVVHHFTGVMGSMNGNPIATLAEDMIHAKTWQKFAAAAGLLLGGFTEIPGEALKVVERLTKQVEGATGPKK